MKTGSNVTAMFTRVAADCLGIRLSNTYLFGLGATLTTTRWKVETMESLRADEQSPAVIHQDETKSESSQQLPTICWTESTHSSQSTSSSCTDMSHSVKSGPAMPSSRCSSVEDGGQAMSERKSLESATSHSSHSTCLDDKGSYAVDMSLNCCLCNFMCWRR